MQIERIEEMRLTAADELQIGALLDASFDPTYDGRSFYQQRQHVRLLVRTNGKLVGHMALSLLAIRMSDKIVQVAGLAEVATAPGYRGRGIATNLLLAAIAEAKLSVADFLVLFGDQPLTRALVLSGKRTRSSSRPTLASGRAGRKWARKRD